MTVTIASGVVARRPVTVDASGNAVPRTDAQNDIGTSARRWQTGWFSAGIFLGANQTDRLGVYEKGTFEPVLRGGTTSGDVLQATANRTGLYLRIGDEVLTYARLSQVSAMTSATGDLQFTAWPFTTLANTGMQPGGSLQVSDMLIFRSGVLTVVPQMGPNSSVVVLQEQRSNLPAAASVTAGAVNASALSPADFALSINYRTA